ncbi:MAG: hypothetical protein WED05_13445 [Candidatus Atabeyarchaeum deiterrae]
MKMSTATKTIIALANVAFLAFAASTVISAVPPAFGFTPGARSQTGSPPNITITWDYAVVNNGFYNIDNFYVAIYLSNSTFSASNSTLPVSIPAGHPYNGVIILQITGLSSTPQLYQVTLIVHSEFAYSFMKYTLNATQSITA